MSEELVLLIQRVFIALALGFLLGLEREYAKRVVDKEEQFAGVRTYTFIALFGFLCAYLAQQFGVWIFVAGLSGLMALIISSYVLSAKAGNYGITTELSGILAFVIGAVVFQGEVLFAVILTVVITSLLSLKLKLHSFIATLTPQEIRAFIQFVIISVVVLPFLPDEPVGPNGVWNLHDIWTMVILVTGISLAGYLLTKLLGSKKGTLLAGILGGLVSSTAVTLSMARRSRQAPTGPHLVIAASIIGATGVLYPRILLEIWVIDRELALRMIAPIAFIMLTAFGIAYLINRKGGQAAAVEVPAKNPLNFGVSIQFAVVYMAVLWLMDLMTTDGSTPGFYAASLVFGATDMDAITLSIAKSTEHIGIVKGATAVLLATLSNTVMKYLIVLFFGDKSLRKWVGFGFGAIFVATVMGLLAMRWL
ncbi:MAG: MgtC/SapB family protein [Flavobacteriales bacterium]